MNIVKVFNLKYSTTNADDINCDIELDNGDVIPFTASKNDSMEHGRNIYADIIDGVYGEIQQADESAITAYKESVLSFEVEKRVREADSKLTDLKRLVDEINYNITDGNLSEVYNTIKSLVQYRKTLIDLDLSASDVELPDPPAVN